MTAPNPPAPEPAPLVAAVIEDARWEALGVAALAERAARAALAATGRDPAACEIGLLAADDARVAALNGAFRGRPVPTNVLSWPAREGLGVPGELQSLGDIALGYETCLREAREAGVPVADHLTHLVVHGVLHLVGHDHEEDAAAEAMERLETNILASLGAPNPYSR